MYNQISLWYMVLSSKHDVFGLVRRENSLKIRMIFFISDLIFHYVWDIDYVMFVILKNILTYVVNKTLLSLVIPCLTSDNPFHC